MFCRNCRKEIPVESIYCSGCGARPLDGKSYCPACAASTTPLSEICVKCGSRLISEPTGYTSGLRRAKSKTVSIVLAIFLGFWTWLYTYKKDGWKFWVGCILLIALISTFGVFVGIAIAESTSGNFGFNEEDLFSSFLLLYLVSLVVGWGINIWAIIDTAIKKTEWYDRYPDF